MWRENYLPMLSGICATGGSFFGKLFANTNVSVNPLASCFYLALMVLMHCMMWTLFTKALINSKTSVGPTLASAATNYLLSGFLGVFYFGEVTSILFWFGIFFVLMGLILISKGNQKQHID